MLACVILAIGTAIQVVGEFPDRVGAARSSSGTDASRDQLPELRDVGSQSVVHKSAPGRTSSSLPASDESRARTLSGAAGAGTPSTVSSAAASTARVRARSCTDARAGRAWYLTWIERYARLMGEPFSRSHEHARNCGRARELAKIARGKAIAWRKRYDAWRDEWNWRAWMPALWVRLGICETGKNPPNWRHNSGAYQGAFGFAVSTWDQFRLPGYPTEAYLASPRQQLNVALVLYRKFGGSPWGCWGA